MVWILFEDLGSVFGSGNTCAGGAAVVVPLGGRGQTAWIGGWAGVRSSCRMQVGQAILRFHDQRTMQAVVVVFLDCPAVPMQATQQIPAADQRRSNDRG